MKRVELNPKGNFDLWDAKKIDELERAEFSENLTKDLIVDNEHVSIWKMILWPGQRLPFTKHKYPFVLGCIRGGIAISRFASGKIDLLSFVEGGTCYQEPREGSSIQDLENIGPDVIEMKILQFKDSPNSWLRAMRVS